MYVFIHLNIYLFQGGMLLIGFLVLLLCSEIVCAFVCVRACVRACACLYVCMSLCLFVNLCMCGWTSVHILCMSVSLFLTTFVCKVWLCLCWQCKYCTYQSWYRWSSAFSVCVCVPQYNTIMRCHAWPKQVFCNTVSIVVHLCVSMSPSFILLNNYVCTNLHGCRKKRLSFLLNLVFRIVNSPGRR
jgi:hypothetical protein